MLQLLLLAVVESVDGTSAPCWGVDRVSRLVDVLHRAARVDEIGGVGARVNDDLVLATAPRAAYGTATSLATASDAGAVASSSSKKRMAVPPGAAGSQSRP